MGTYLRPVSLDDALQALAAKPYAVLAGGTDFYPARVGRPLRDDVLDITGLSALRGIRREEGGWRVGCLATWTDLVRAPLPPCFDGLKQAARAVGGVQIQNSGTLCGNICNASPAADGAPNLLVLNAEVELASLRGERRLPLPEFITGNRKTARRADELVTALWIPAPAQSTRSWFLKLGTRKYLVISIVMAAGLIEEAENGTVMSARIAIGACSAVAQRLPKLEAALLQRSIDSKLGDAVTAAHLDALSPISDIRGPAAYRSDAALSLTRRLLNELGQGA